jgi:hypothetical protein
MRTNTKPNSENIKNLITADDSLTNGFLRVVLMTNKESSAENIIRLTGSDAHRAISVQFKKWHKKRGTTKSLFIKYNRKIAIF